MFYGINPHPLNESKPFPIRLPLAPEERTGWKGYPVFKGTRKDGLKLLCHVSALAHGHCPHPPHQHTDEEVLVLLRGEVEIILPREGAPPNEQRRRLTQGQFAYYPRDYPHTLATLSREPANYVMLKWYRRRGEHKPTLPFSVQDACAATPAAPATQGFRSRQLLVGRTEYLARFESHVSTLAPGRGYEPHEDRHDVIIIMLEGEVETRGHRLTPHDMIVHAAGVPHGMRNTGDREARYLVFEFHFSRPLHARILQWARRRLRSRRGTEASAP
jgi:quercetin dioxygenase-like cupin family protein